MNKRATTSPLRVIFMGSPAFAVPTLQALIDSPHELVCVYTQPPRPAQRGHKEMPTAIHSLAAEHAIPVRTPTRLKDEALHELRATTCDVIVVVAYGLLLPQPVLNHAPCVNIHPSALPRWRGPAPLHHTILSGDTTTEVCIMQLDVGMDTGPVYTRTPIRIGANETTGELHDRLAPVGAAALLDVLDNFEAATPTPQPAEGVTIAPKVSKAMCPINWQKSAQEIHNHIRGLHPFPVATCRYENQTIRMHKAALIDTSADTVTPADVGTITNITPAGITVTCGDNSSILLTHLQRAGKAVMPASAFIRGCPLSVGNKFC